MTRAARAATRVMSLHQSDHHDAAPSDDAGRPHWRCETNPTATPFPALLALEIVAMASRSVRLGQSVRGIGTGALAFAAHAAPAAPLAPSKPPFSLTPARASELSPTAVFAFMELAHEQSSEGFRRRGTSRSSAGHAAIGRGSPPQQGHSLARTTDGAATIGERAMADGPVGQSI